MKEMVKWRFIANSSACTTTEFSILLTSCLTAIKNHVIKYCTTVYERNGKKLFWSIKNSGEILNTFKSRGFLASGLSTYDFSTLYTTLPHNQIKEKLTKLIEQEGSLYLVCNDKNAFFTSEQPKRYKLLSCQKKCDALHYLLDNIFIRFGLKFYRQIVGIPMGTNCAPLVANLFLFCYERDFMLSLSDNNQTDIIEAFNSTSRYLDDLFNIDNPCFEQMVGQIYPTELQLNKANSSDTEASFLDLNLSITNSIVSSKTLLQQGISEPIFYGDLVYKFKRIVGKPNFSDQLKKIVKRYIRVRYNLDIMRQSDCLVLNPITVYSYGFVFNCTTVGQASDSMTALP